MEQDDQNSNASSELKIKLNMFGLSSDEEDQDNNNDNSENAPNALGDLVQQQNNSKNSGNLEPENPPRKESIPQDASQDISENDLNELDHTAIQKFPSMINIAPAFRPKQESQSPNNESRIPEGRKSPNFVINKEESKNSSFKNDVSPVDSVSNKSSEDNFKIRFVMGDDEDPIIINGENSSDSNISLNIKKLEAEQPQNNDQPEENEESCSLPERRSQLEPKDEPKEEAKMIEKQGDSSQIEHKEQDENMDEDDDSEPIIIQIPLDSDSEENGDDQNDKLSQNDFENHGEGEQDGRKDAEIEQNEIQNETKVVSNGPNVIQNQPDKPQIEPNLVSDSSKVVQNDLDKSVNEVKDYKICENNLDNRANNIQEEQKLPQNQQLEVQNGSNKEKNSPLQPLSEGKSKSNASEDDEFFKITLKIDDFHINEPQTDQVAETPNKPESAGPLSQKSPRSSRSKVSKGRSGSKISNKSNKSKKSESIKSNRSKKSTSNKHLEVTEPKPDQQDEADYVQKQDSAQNQDQDQDQDQEMEKDEPEVQGEVDDEESGGLIKINFADVEGDSEDEEGHNLIQIPNLDQDQEMGQDGEPQPEGEANNDQDDNSSLKFNIAIDDINEGEDQESPLNKIKLNFNEGEDQKSDDDNKFMINVGENDDEEEEDGPIQIKIHGIDDDNDQDEAKSESKIQEPEEAQKQDNDENDDGFGKITIPIDLEHPDEQKDAENEAKIAQKRQEKEGSKLENQDSEDTKIKLFDIKDEPEVQKEEDKLVQTSLRNFYKLESQKVTIQVDLQDPSKPISEENRTKIRGQTIMCFNLSINANDLMDKVRDLRLDIHCKEFDITRISLAQRYKKKDDNGKVTDILHDRLDDLEFKPAINSTTDFCAQNQYATNYQNDQTEDKDEVEDAFEIRPKIQKFEELLSTRFKHEKKKGLLTIDRVLYLENGDNFPPSVDIIIDYEITDILDYGLTYRKTLEASGHGCYLATTHRYFETQYWLPCIDSLKQRNKWKLTIITQNSHQVACSGILDKISEISGTDKLGYHYRVEHLTSACKLGFFIGSQFRESENRYFSNQRKQDEFQKSFVISSKVFMDVTDMLEQILGKDFPYSKLDLVFVPNLFIGSKLKRRTLCYSGVCFIDENLIFSESVIEKRFSTYFHFAYAVASNYFGCYIQESNHTDFWLIEGILHSLGNLFATIKCGSLMYKYKTMKNIEYVQKRSQDGQEYYSLVSENLPHPSHLQYDDFYYIKSGLVMHVIKNKIHQDHFHKLLRIIVKDCSKKHTSLDTKDFNKKFKKLCGFNPRKLIFNWVCCTGVLELNFDFEYSKKNNNINLTIDQRNLFTHYLAREKYLAKKNIEGTLSIMNLYSSDYKDLFEEDQLYESYSVEKNRESLRLFNGPVSLVIYETDGSLIKPEQHKIDLAYNKPQIKLTIQLRNKVRKTNQNKKRDYTCGPVIASDQWKFQPSEHMRFPDGTFFKNEIFNLKNLDCPLLWVRMDPELDWIRKVNINQSEDNWHYQLIKEKDIVGQYDAIQALKNFTTESAYESIKNVINNKEYFIKIRQAAVKALTEMNTKEFNKFLSTEKFLVKIYQEYDLKANPKYCNNQLQYFLDKSLIKHVSNLKESVAITNLALHENYDPQQLKRYTTKDLNRFMLDLLKRHYSSKFLFDDSFYIANIISALGHMLNMKVLHETLLEIMRQAKLDLSHSMTKSESVISSHNFLVLKSSISALTNLYENMKICYKQYENNTKIRKAKPSEEAAEAKKNATKKEAQKLHAEIDAKRKLKKFCPMVAKFMRELTKFEVFDRFLDLQVLHFRYRVVKSFVEEGFMNAFYHCLIIINKEIDNEKPQLVAEYARNFREYLEDRIYHKKNLDYTELLNFESKRTKGIYYILWEMLTLEFAMLHNQFKLEIKSLLWMFFRNLGLNECQLDKNWNDLKNTKFNLSQLYEQRSLQDKTSSIGRRRNHEYESELMSDQFSMYGKQRGNGSNFIKVPALGHGASNVSQSRMNESVCRSEYSYVTENKRKRYDEESYVDDNQSQANLIDPEELENLDWKDCCLRIIDKIEEYEEADDFKRPVTEEDLGEFWEDYQAQITYPIDLATIRAKIFEGEYVGVGNFEFDMRKIFDNCKKFNDPTSSIYECAEMLDNIFTKLFRPIKKKFTQNNDLEECGIRFTIDGIGI